MLEPILWNVLERLLRKRELLDLSADRFECDPVDAGRLQNSRDEGYSAL